MCRRKAELAACFLLQSGGGERRIGVTLDGLGLNRRDVESGGFERLLERLCFGARADVEPLQLFAVGANEAGFEGFVARRRQGCDQRPIFLADEFFDFELAVGDKPQGDRLNAARGPRAWQLAPQHWRQREADQVIECPARQIGVHQCLVDLARMRHGIRDRLLGDGIKDYALDRLRFECLFLLEHLQDVPGDRLALAIGVGRQNELVRVFDRPGDLVQALLRLGIDLPDHAKIGIRLDRTGFGRQVANMAERGQNFVALAEILIDRFRLCGRLHQYKIHVNPMIYLVFCQFYVQVAAAGRREHG